MSASGTFSANSGDSITIRPWGVDSLVYIDGVKQATNQWTAPSSGKHSIRYYLGGYGVGNFSFATCTYIETLSIPDGVLYLGLKSFEGCTSLTTVVIPESVSLIDIMAFNACSNLATIIIKALNPPTLGANVFPNNVSKIYVPSMSVELYKTTWSNLASKIEAI